MNRQSSDIRGINWADARDNFVDGWIIPSGINHHDNTNAVVAQARELLLKFKQFFGVNTIRFGVNPATVTDKDWWPKYRAIINESVSLDFSVILGCWESAKNRNGKIDDIENFHLMWSRIIQDFAENEAVHFEIFNEPHGYDDTEWRDLAAAWIEHYVEKLGGERRSRVLVSGTGYNEHLKSISRDSRFDGCMLSFHFYAWFGGKHQTISGWEEEIKERIDHQNSCRTVITEWGAPMKSKPDDFYIGSPVRCETEQAYVIAMANVIKDWNMGSIYWPGLRDGDDFSLTERTHDSLVLRLTNESGRVQLFNSFNH